MQAMKSTANTSIVRCDECNGKGRDQNNRRCRGCNGSGYVERWHKATYPVKPGHSGAARSRPPLLR